MRLKTRAASCISATMSLVKENFKITQEVEHTALNWTYAELDSRHSFGDISFILNNVSVQQCPVELGM